MAYRDGYSSLPEKAKAEYDRIFGIPIDSDALESDHINQQAEKESSNHGE